MSESAQPAKVSDEDAEDRTEQEVDEHPEQNVEERTEQEVLRDRRIEQVRQDIQRRKRRLTLNVTLILVLVGVGLAAAYIYREQLFTEENFVLIFMGVGGLFVLAVQILNSGETDTTSLQADLDKLLLDKEVGERLRAKTRGPRREDTNAPPSYFDSLVETNVVNLREYYNLVRVHTNNSFRISLFAGLFGFVLIAAGLTIGFNKGAEDYTIAYLSAASGVFIEFISGVFFYLYSRTVRQLKSYHDSLLAVQNVLLSLKLTEMADDRKRPDMIRDLLKYLMEQRREAGIELQEPSL